MLSNKTDIRVRYADTDKMQFVYNGKYLEYFEVGRTELLRNIGLPYSEIENSGYQLPLLETGIQYKKPAYYDDVLEIEASLAELYTAKVHIEYVIRKKVDGEIITTGFTDHIFINEKTKKPTRPPKIYINALKQYF